MKKGICITVIALLTSLVAWAVTPQDLVKQTYAELGFLNDASILTGRANTIGETIPATPDSMRQALQKEHLEFFIDDFQFGTVAGNTKAYHTIVSDMSGKQILYITVGQTGYKIGHIDGSNDKFEGPTLNLHWAQSSEHPKTAELPIQTLGLNGFNNYFSYHVEAKYQGKTTYYRAALFIDDKGKPHFIDPFIENSGLDNLLLAPVHYPMGLTRTGRSKSPEVIEWLKDHNNLSCELDKVCCDPTTMKCSINLPPELLSEDSPGKEVLGCGPQQNCLNGDTCSSLYSDVFDTAGYAAGAPYYDTQEHNTNGPPNSSFHWVNLGWVGRVTYTQKGKQLQNGDWPCWASASIYVPHASGEQGSVKWFHTHYPNSAGSSWNQEGPGDFYIYAQGGGGVTSCLIPGCGTLSINFVYNGESNIGVTFNPVNALYTQKANATFAQYAPYETAGNQGTPIAIDLGGEGTENIITNTADGIFWTFLPRFRPIRIAWTRPNSKAGWLVLDRNGNGYIDDTTETFGGSTKQSPYDCPLGVNGECKTNGFRALALFAQPGQELVTQEDCPRCRILVSSHVADGKMTGTMLTFHEAGIKAISTKYTIIPKKDNNGNGMDVSADVFMEDGRVIKAYDYSLNVDWKALK